MGVTKNKIIEHKIFKEHDLNKIMSYFIEVEKELVVEKQYNRLSFRVYYEDNTSIDNNNPDVLDETKLINAAHFTLSNLYQDLHIEIDLSKSKGRFSIRGQNKDWVDAKFSQLEDLIKAVPNQNKWLAGSISQFVIANLISAPFVLIVSYFFLTPIVDELTPNMFLGMFLHVFISSIAMLRLSTTYTNIEFDTSLEHLNKNKQRKNNIKYLAGTYLFPVVLVILQYST
ncbi:MULTISPECIES: hypothetical protein [Planococcus]|uniref:hypothetical protein n=1 Tax=Planococcus TaxID=1372 RepID=UPI00115DCF76|nr:hypothetical protein [Planococcus soli]